MNAWKVFAQYEVWNDSYKLFIRRRDREGVYFVKPLEMERVADGAAWDIPTFGQSREERQDGADLLQACLDAAWEMGLRPTGFADHTNELKAVRFHLEDMRLLAKVRDR